MVQLAPTFGFESLGFPIACASGARDTVVKHAQHGYYRPDKPFFMQVRRKNTFPNSQTLAVEPVPFNKLPMGCSDCRSPKFPKMVCSGLCHQTEFRVSKSDAMESMI